MFQLAIRNNGGSDGNGVDDDDFKVQSNFLEYP